MKNTSKTIIGAVIGVIVLGGIIWIARPAPSGTQEANLNSGTAGTLLAQESAFDFGTISMAAGNVSHQFKIKNSGVNPVTIEKMYTSCMCTAAKLTAGGKTFGPYGMPGHGFIPRINKTIESNEEGKVLVVFDPAAHGPAGIGEVERQVVINLSDNQKVVLAFKATVTP